jgi:hypothetical protein
VKPAVATLVEGPRPELAVVLADDVIEQDQARALRHRADLGPDDAGGGQVALEQVVLEVVIEEVGGAAGEQADGVVERALVEAAHVLGELGHPRQFQGVLGEGIGRDLVEERLEGVAHLGHIVLVLLVGVGVVGRVAGDLAQVLVVVLAEEEVVAVLVRGEGGGHQQRHETVLGQLQLVDDLGRSRLSA